MERASITIDLANIQFPHYCWSRWTAGLSDAGLAEKARIEALIKDKTITFAQGVEMVVNGVRTGESDQYHDWPQRCKRVRATLSRDPAHAVLFQEVSFNGSADEDKSLRSCVSTLGNVVFGTLFKPMQYTVFPVVFKDPKLQSLEERLKRGNAVVVRGDVAVVSTDSVQYTIESEKKTQTRGAAVATFKTHVLGQEILVRAVSVQISGYWEGALENLKKAQAEVAAAGDAATDKQKVNLEKAKASYQQYLVDYTDGTHELKHYLSEIDKNTTADVTVIGGDFNFCPVKGDSAVESGLQPRSTTGGQQGVLQSFGYTVDETFRDPTQNKRSIDFAAVKLSEVAAKKFSVEISTRILPNAVEGYVSDHAFVRTQISFASKL